MVADQYKEGHLKYLSQDAFQYLGTLALEQVRSRNRDIWLSGFKLGVPTRITEGKWTTTIQFIDRRGVEIELPEFTMTINIRTDKNLLCESGVLLNWEGNEVASWRVKPEPSLENVH